MNENNKVFGDYGDYDDANAFGLGADGRPVGWNPIWGSSVAVGVGTLAAVVTRQVSSKDKYAELIGFGAAFAPSLTMAFFKRTRAAGWAGMITSVLNNGVRFAEQMLSDKEKAKIEAANLLEAAKNAAQGAQPNAPAAQTQQGVNVQQIPAFAGPQLGLVVPQATEALQGAQFGNGQAPQLLGNGQAPQLLGASHGQMSGHFGSTHFNKS